MSQAARRDDPEYQHRNQQREQPALASGAGDSCLGVSARCSGRLARRTPAVMALVLGVIGANHLALVLAVLWPRGQLLGPNLVRLPASAVRRREISLTFDDGPDPDVTPRVLDLLDRYQAKASFFCIGENAAAQPELVKEIARRGHSVENHSYRHHRAFAFFGISRLKREVDAAQSTVASITGRTPVFFRAPPGSAARFSIPCWRLADCATCRGRGAASTR